MFLLGTNVIPETMRSRPDRLVQAWLNAQVAETVYLSSITVAELLFGIGVLPEGQRQRALAEKVDRVLDLFQTRILPFDAAAARTYADFALKSRAAGESFPTKDGNIAAIAAVHGFSVASRDTSAFVAAGLCVINPWG
jgi:toxin FitB